MSDTQQPSQCSSYGRGSYTADRGRGITTSHGCSSRGSYVPRGRGRGMQPSYRQTRDTSVPLHQLPTWLRATIEFPEDIRVRSPRTSRSAASTEKTEHPHYKPFTEKPSATRFMSYALNADKYEMSAGTGKAATLLKHNERVRTETSSADAVQQHAPLRQSYDYQHPPSKWDSATITCTVCGATYDAKSDIYIRWKTTPSTSIQPTAVGRQTPYNKDVYESHCCTSACCMKVVQAMSSVPQQRPEELSSKLETVARRFTEVLQATADDASTTVDTTDDTGSSDDTPPQPPSKLQKTTDKDHVSVIHLVPNHQETKDHATPLTSPVSDDDGTTDHRHTGHHRRSSSGSSSHREPQHDRRYHYYPSSRRWNTRDTAPVVPPHNGQFGYLYSSGGFGSQPLGAYPVMQQRSDRYHARHEPSEYDFSRKRVVNTTYTADYHAQRPSRQEYHRRRDDYHTHHHAHENDREREQERDRDRATERRQERQREYDRDQDQKRPYTPMILPTSVAYEDADVYDGTRSPSCSPSRRQDDSDDDSTSLTLTDVDVPTRCEEDQTTVHTSSARSSQPVIGVVETPLVSVHPPVAKTVSAPAASSIEGHEALQQSQDSIQSMEPRSLETPDSQPARSSSVMHDVFDAVV